MMFEKEWYIALLPLFGFLPIFIPWIDLASAIQIFCQTETRA